MSSKSKKTTTPPTPTIKIEKKPTDVCQNCGIQRKSHDSMINDHKFAEKVQRKPYEDVRRKIIINYQKKAQSEREQLEASKNPRDKCNSCGIERAKHKLVSQHVFMERIKYPDDICEECDTRRDLHIGMDHSFI